MQDLFDTNSKIFVAASGAGAGIQSALWAQPGASAYLEGCVFPYSWEQGARFLGFLPSRVVGRAASIDLAISAYRQVADCDSDKNPIGLGLTASVTSAKPHRGEHRIFATVISRTQVLSAYLILSKDSLNLPEVGRYVDGRMADQLGLDLLRAAAGLEPKHEFDDDIEIKDVSEFARNHFLSRPLFYHDGSRGMEPHGEIKLYPGAFNPLHQGHLESANEDVIFHITANPPHKPALSLQDMLERSIQFRGVRDVLFTEDDALYIDKARRFAGSTFYIGTDVMERILDPKWGPEIEPMLSEFQELGTHFMVMPRGDQRVRDLLPLIPEAYRRLFTEMPRGNNSDMSSTQIRAKREAGDQ